MSAEINDFVGNCGQCPNVQAGLGAIADIQTQCHLATEIAMLDEINPDLAEQFADKFVTEFATEKQKVEGLEEISDIYDSEQKLRLAAVIFLDRMTKRREKIEKKLARITTECPGPFELSGKDERDDELPIELEIIVCSSPMAPEDGYERVRIKRNYLNFN